jgi:signal transduction histidine kinase
MSLRRWQHVVDVYAGQKKIPSNLSLDSFYYDPYPKGLSPAVLWVLVGTMMTLLVVSGVLIQVRRFNQRLKGEINERKAIEGRLISTNQSLKQAMSQLVQSEKLASLGALVAGVSHELNTPIGNVRVTATTLAEKVHDMSDHWQRGEIRKSVFDQFLKDCTEATELMERNILRAVTLIGSFKLVAVDQSSERRRTFDVKEVIAEVIQILHPMLIKSKSTVDMAIDSGITLDSYPGPLGQVVTNLVANSLLHGFSTGSNGTITLKAYTASDRVILDYTDNGQGMSTEIAARAFDPFFTTRMGVGGSGLGLYIVYNIVTGTLGGTISLETSPGHGVRFRIDIPVSAPDFAKHV